MTTSIFRQLYSWFAIVTLLAPVLAIPAPIVTATTTTTINQNTIIIAPTDITVNGFPLNSIASDIEIKSLDLAVAAMAAEDLASKQIDGQLGLPDLISDFPAMYSSVINSIDLGIFGFTLASTNEAATTSSTSAIPPPPISSSTSHLSISTTASCDAPITSLASGTKATTAPAPTDPAISSAIALFCTPEETVTRPQGKPYYLPESYKFTPTHNGMAGFLVLSMTWSSDPTCKKIAFQEPHPPGIFPDPTMPGFEGRDLLCNKFMTEAVAACPATGTGAKWETDCIIYGYEAYWGPTA